MPRATCRCGETLTFPDDGPDRIVCPRCSARIRVRRSRSPLALGDRDGFVRFACPCGRRLKVRVEAEMPEFGKCPDCGRVVPVPSLSAPPSPTSPPPPAGPPESVTAELDAADHALLERWKQNRHSAQAAAQIETTVPFPAASAAPLPAPSPAPPLPAPTPAPARVEAGLRVCPRCGKPVHLSSIVCRECGAHVPKR